VLAKLRVYGPDLVYLRYDLFLRAYEDEFYPVEFIHSLHAMYPAALVPVRCARAVEHLYG